MGPNHHLPPPPPKPPKFMNTNMEGTLPWVGAVWEVTRAGDVRSGGEVTDSGSGSAWAAAASHEIGGFVGAALDEHWRPTQNVATIEGPVTAGGEKGFVNFGALVQS